MLSLAFLILVFFVQTILPPFLPLIGPKPDFLLVTIIVFGLLKGPNYGWGIGFGAGLLEDLFLGGMFGVYTIIKAVIGGLTGLLEGNIYKENLFLPPVIIFTATLIHEALVIILSREILFEIHLVYFLKTAILPEALINSLLGIIIYLLFYRAGNHGGNRYG